MYDRIKTQFENQNEDGETLDENCIVSIDMDYEILEFRRRDIFDENGDKEWSGAIVIFDIKEAKKLKDFLNFALQD